MKATDVLVQCLENEGVEYIFGIMGKETLDLVDSLSRSKIQFVNTRHEQGAAFMADVYGRLSHKAGVCLSTLGPGATNLLTGIASANLDFSPVVAFIGQAGLERQHKESHQYLDLVKMFEPATKWSVQIKDSLTIAEVVHKAFRTAKMEKSGAVIIELPENLAAQKITDNAMADAPLPACMPVKEQIQEAIDQINNSQKPFIIVGNGAIRGNAAEEVQELIARLQAPATHSMKAKGILPKGNPYNYFTFGFNEQDEVLPGIEEADLLIVLGFDFVERLPKEWNKKKVPVIHIHAVPAESDEYYPIKSELVGDIKRTLQAFNVLKIEPKPWQPSGNLREKIKQAYHLNEETYSSLSITSMLQAIEKRVSDQTIVLSDVGSHKVSIARTYQPKKPGSLIMSNGLASMGIAIPGAIGAKLACPAHQVICITGDGGALMNFAEIETAARLGLPFVIIVLNDSKLKLEEQMMLQSFSNDYGTYFGNPDFVLLAQSFGIKGVRPADLLEFEGMLDEALTKSELTLIEMKLGDG
ncbi:acetolactate synthase large subunit [Bacillus sp. DTU_2020_1000418_1_SI_GHA_SEK_038]|uniref:acetolactate synthase large subunit n=1 Tax=Bacillus sp. DTU_2020_1000418_1_SI_GHA_SEK_038 TaxID=3077585 RepID=UPI0028ED3CB9|nr:acetolactate synthase large subunit [Bacillus sp. DTU_2020_1000418_1_SI_GHA_SEK_038]WNS75060.1 acetolactate synthase large subunit [Bacillus sp. DTU_2020_1000418_1_SI_GHA_SEK_038]